MKKITVKSLGMMTALFFGTGLTSVYALTEKDFTNTAIVLSAPTQYDHDVSNNEGAVVVMPKGLTITNVVDASEPSTPTKVGELINYTVSLDNIGLLALTDVAVHDSINPALNLSLAAGDSNNDNILDADEIWVYAGAYAITQADIDTSGGGDGDIDITATVTTNELSALSDSAEVTITPAPKFTVAKSVDKTSVTEPTMLTYEIKVTNKGNQSLTGIALVNNLPDGSIGTLVGPSTDIGIAGSLDVEESWVYHISYYVSQVDIDNGAPLINVVTVTTTETGLATETDKAQTTIAKAPSLQVIKNVDSVSISEPTFLNYSISVVNTGNVTLNNVLPFDLMPDGTAGIVVGPFGDGGTAGAIDVGETWTYTTSYIATQADMDALADLVGRISITTDETGEFAINDAATTTINSEPLISVSKTVDKASLSAPGSLNYEIIVTNTGNVSLNDVLPVDTLPDGSTGALIGPLNDTGLIGQLDVGEAWEFTTSYTVTQAEIDIGAARTNSVSVSSTETGADRFSATAQTTLARSPAFSVEKNVDRTNISAPSVLNYQVVIDNTGNTSLSDVVVTDTMPDGSTAVLSGPVADAGALGILDVGETWRYLVQYSASQDDIDAGFGLTSSVSVSTAQAGSLEASVITSVAQDPSISLVKASIETHFTAFGDTLNYALTVSNTGNVALSNIVLSDPLADAGSLACDRNLPFALAPSEQANCTTIHTITSNDIVVSQFANQASVSSVDPSGNDVVATSNTVIVPMLRIPPVATDDEFLSTQSAGAVTLSGARDDTDENGDLDVSSLSLTGIGAFDRDGDGDNDVLIVSGEGVWLVNDTTGEVMFAPEPGFTADPASTTYTVSDHTDLVSNNAVLSIDYPQSAPVAKDDYKQNAGVQSPSNPTTLNLFTDNGNGIDTDLEGDIDEQSINIVDANAIDTDSDGYNDTLIVAEQGTWVVANATGDITFTPHAGTLIDPTPIFYTVSDINGLVSNQASITVDYPQTAPLANDDKTLQQTLGQPVLLAVVANDIDPEDNLDPTTVKLIDSESGKRVTTLTVIDQGVWTVDVESGDVTYTPEKLSIVSPAPIQYTVFDSTGLESNLATITVSFEEPAVLEGIVWIDSDRDGKVGANEDRKTGWVLKVFNDTKLLVATAITDADGYFMIDGLIPGVFRVDFYNENGVFMDSQTTAGPIVAGQVVNLLLPVDPGGVVYDSITRLPVAGVTLNIINDDGNLLHARCLYDNQQSQVTLIDGLYAFNLIPGAHSTCPTEGAYKIQIANAPEDYYPNFSSIIRQEGAQGCGDATLGCAVSGTFDTDPTENNCTIDSLPSTNACEVQPQPDAPIDSQDTVYFVEFYYQAGDRNIKFNHLPIDARANDAQILLSKSADKRSVSVGSLVEYTLVAENTKDVPAVDIVIVDVPPANFSLVASSVRIIQVGADGNFDTEDDVIKTLYPGDLFPILLSDLEFEPAESIRIKYVMRVGIGVVAGSYANKAGASGPGGIASNTVSSTVTVVPDVVMEQATLIGKVFNDRDSDGSQDAADATGVALRSHYFGWNGLRLPPVPGRNSVNDDPANHAAIINMPLTNNNKFMVVTREGTRISVDNQGRISEAHIGAIAQGLNGQDIRVCTQFVSAVPTGRQGITPADGKPADVMQIVIHNYGVNEEGIPGVRLATVTGLLIETDAYGRYSIPDVDAGTTGIGQNFVLKVDQATLPQGSRFTTENPYVLRILNTSLNKINFGVHVPDEDPYLEAKSALCNSPATQRENQSVVVNLGSVFFDTNEHNVRDDQRGIVLDIVKKLREYGGGQITIEAHTDAHGSREYNLALAERRAEAIRDILSDSLAGDLMDQISVDVDPAAYAEQSE